MSMWLRVIIALSIHTVVLYYLGFWIWFALFALFHVANMGYYYHVATQQYEEEQKLRFWQKEDTMR
jgi:hypothetical protein